ncbi:MAG TPA: hypothetical protein VM307_00645 [Egibacteraceae bacterium]|nr:hypothetical protein [Egibacteraceae bacterium]
MNATAGAHCGACGRAVTDGDHGPCARLLAFDPPRFCEVCGFRLDVQIFPDGYRSSCRECRRRAAMVTR